MNKNLTPVRVTQLFDKLFDRMDPDDLYMLAILFDEQEDDPGAITLRQQFLDDVRLRLMDQEGVEK